MTSVEALETMTTWPGSNVTQVQKYRRPTMAVSRPSAFRTVRAKADVPKYIGMSLRLPLRARSADA